MISNHYFDITVSHFMVLRLGNVTWILKGSVNLSSLSTADSKSVLAQI